MFLSLYRVIHEQWKQRNEFSELKIEITLKKVDEKDSKEKGKMATESQKRKAVEKVRQK